MTPILDRKENLIIRPGDGGDSLAFPFLEHNGGIKEGTPLDLIDPVGAGSVGSDSEQ